MKKTFTLSFVAILIATFTTQVVSAQITTLQSIKDQYVAPGVILPSAMLSGIVISDSTGKNVSKGNAVIQSGGKGILFRFKGGNAYTIGDSVSINVTGDSLILYNGALEITRSKTNPVPPAVAQGVYVAPTLTTLPDITANLDSLGYILVKVVNATASPAGTFSGSKTLTDASSNTMILYTSKSAKFAISTMPTGSQEWTGYVVSFNGTPEFTIRNLSDFVPLALVFKGFNAETKGTSTVLTWNTASEINTSKFVIEKSYDGIAFSSYSSVDAKGKSTNVYTFTDASNKVNTTVYYRLKSLDQDGKYMYSSIVKVKFASTVKLTLAPNPTTLTTKLSYDASVTDAVARIITANGTLVKQVTLPAGSTATDVSVSSLVKGVYYVAITKNGTTSTLSFVKQ